LFLLTFIYFGKKISTLLFPNASSNQMKRRKRERTRKEEREKER
jgi:hypothetical protein